MTSASAPAGGAEATLSLADYCDQTVPLWDYQGIPNADDDLTQEQRDDAVASLTAAGEVVRQGVALGVLDQLQAEALARSVPIYIALYRNPELVGADAMPSAEELGLTDEEYALMSSEEFNQLSQASYTALLNACGGSNQ